VPSASPLKRPKTLSEPTISRLPIYQRIAEEMAQRGIDRIDSKTIGELAGVTATTVRRDLSGLGTLGTRGAGYDTRKLSERIADTLGVDKAYDVIVVGMGNLGSALVNSTSFLTRGAHLVGIYDTSPSVVGTKIGDLTVANFVGPLAPATIAVLCVPPEACQEVANRLVASGITALLNFAPQVITVPPHIVVHYVDFSIELQVLMYRQEHRVTFSGVVHPVGATPQGLSGGPGATK